MPKVSVLIPNYNHTPYLRQRIDSVLQQTYKDIEVIILDDCSTDNSKGIIEEYRSNNLVKHIVYNEANSGSTFKQWQKGISLAQGDYIWIAESDDWCEHTLLEALVSGVVENDNIVISYCGSVVVNEYQEILYTSTSKKMAEVFDGTSFIKSQLLESNVIFNASMAIFHKNAFKEISLEFTDYKFCGDWLFWIMMAQKGRVYKSGKYLNYFRKHQLDVSRRSMADGTYYLEYPRLMKYLLANNLIDQSQFAQLLFKKYKRLQRFNGNRETKRNLLVDYRSMIGNGQLNKIKLMDSFHEVYIGLWIVTPGFLKKAIRTVLPSTNHQ